MKRVHRKTQEERRGEYLVPTRVKDTSYTYWTCDRCCLAFEDDDIILVKSDGNYCPNVRGLFKRMCLERVYGSGGESFKKYYRIV